MEGHLANIRVRSMGTLGGNLAFADPHSDPATFLLAADAAWSWGYGPIGAGRWPWPTSSRARTRRRCEPGELLVRIEVPAMPAGAAMAHLRFAFHERPAVTVSTLARVAGGAAGGGARGDRVRGRPAPPACTPAEALLIGLRPRTPGRERPLAHLHVVDRAGRVARVAYAAPERRVVAGLGPGALRVRFFGCGSASTVGARWRGRRLGTRSSCFVSL